MQEEIYNWQDNDHDFDDFHNDVNHKIHKDATGIFTNNLQPL